MGELETLRIFLAVAEHRSFAGAARALGLTPASVTRAIAGLEAQIGAQLFKRTTRRVSLTAAGAAHAGRVAGPVAALAGAAEAARESQGLTTGQIRVSVPMSLGLRLLPPVLSQFAALHPQTSVVLTLSDSFIDIVKEDYDLAIRISGPPGDKSTIWRKIAPVPRLLVAAPGYLRANGTPGAPGDLAAHTCLSYADGPAPEEWKLTRGEIQRSHVARGRFCANNGDLLAQLVRQGEGIALLPRFIVDEDLRAGGLEEVLPGWRAPEIWLTLFYPPYDRLPLRVAAFSDFFEHHVTDGAGWPPPRG